MCVLRRCWQGISQKAERERGRGVNELGVGSPETEWKAEAPAQRQGTQRELIPHEPGEQKAGLSLGGI